MSGGDLPLAMTMGDPAGVGPIIASKAYEIIWARDGRPFYVIAAPGALDHTGATLVPISDPSETRAAFADGLPVLTLPTAPITLKPGHPDPATAPAIVESIRLAVAHTQAGKAAAVVTNPIAKALLYRAGFKHPGHTEYLAELANPAAPPRPIMMLAGGGLRVALVTIHKPLATVIPSLTPDLIAETGRIVHAALKRDFGIASPRIGLCGVNPHAGEDGEIGREEIDIVNPAAARLRAEGIDISDARPGDTIFHEARTLDGKGGRWDAVIAMYHDQGLIPVKTLDMWGGVNVTLGLPFIRTSPDHGVAYDAAASGKAHAESLIAALDLADKMAHARAAAS